MKNTVINKLLLISLISFVFSRVSIPIQAQEPSVTFTWVDQTAKEAKVENSYITAELKGAQGFALTEIKLKANPLLTITSGIRPFVEGAPTPELFVGFGMPDPVPLEDTSIFVENSSSLLKVTATTIFKDVNWTFVYLFTDAPYFIAHFEITFLTDIEFERLDYEFQCPHGGGQQAAWVNSTTGELQTLEIVGEEPTWRELWPLGEPWIAWWDPATGLAMGQIFLNPSNVRAFYLNDETSTAGHTTWYTAMALDTSVEAGTKFEDASMYWFGQGDYTEVRKLAKQASWAMSVELGNMYIDYSTTHNVTWTDYLNAAAGLLEQVQNLEAQLDEAKAAQTTQLYTGLAGGLGGGIVVGVGVGWFLKKRK